MLELSIYYLMTNKKSRIAPTDLINQEKNNAISIVEKSNKTCTIQLVIIELLFIAAWLKIIRATP